MGRTGLGTSRLIQIVLTKYNVDVRGSACILNIIKWYLFSLPRKSSWNTSQSFSINGVTIPIAKEIKSLEINLDGKLN